MMEATEAMKQTAHQLIDELPDNATLATLLSTFQVRHDIEAGMADAKAERVYSTVESRERFGIDNA